MKITTRRPLRSFASFLTLCSVFLAFVAAPSWAADKKTQKPVSKKTPTALSQKVLWDAWYIVTLNDSVHFAYYNERADITDGRIHLQLRIWKKEEGFINEENIGAFSKDDADLSPLFYNYRGTYKTSEILVDGTVDENHFLTTKARKGGQDVPATKKQVPKNTILSYMFPVWLSRKVSTLKQDRPVSFYALSEDRIDEGFPITTGSVTLVKPDEIAAKTKTQRVKVNFADTDSYWWIGPKGVAIAIDRPLQKTLIQLVPKDKAEAFLK